MSNRGRRQIILASASPRRKEILQAAGYEFVVCPTDSDEGKVSGSPEETVMELARIKAKSCARVNTEGDLTGKLIIGADTLVFLGGAQLGKPSSKEEWRKTISDLSGKTHRVLTGVCLMWDDKICTFYSSTSVDVNKMTEEEIDEFIARDEDMDKAGGYAIQGAFAKYIPSISGEYNNVVGFPIAKFREILLEQSIDL